MADNRWTSPVLWHEGLFVRPHLFQQQTRYFENLLEGRTAGLRPFSWGFLGLEISTDALSLGRVALETAAGVMPDGTPFSLPHHDRSPAALEVDAQAVGEKVYLTLPMGSPYQSSVGGTGKVAPTHRFEASAAEIRNAFDADRESARPVEIPTADLVLRLKRESDDRGGDCQLALAHIVDVTSDGVVLDPSFIPPVLSCAASEALCGHLAELRRLLTQKGDTLSTRVVGSYRGDQEGLLDFLRLQTINRYEPLFSHYCGPDGAAEGQARNGRVLENLHPETVFGACLQAAGDLATLTSGGRRPVRMPRYAHDDLRGCFEPLLEELRRSLTVAETDVAILIPLEGRDAGAWIGRVDDAGLYAGARFLLEVSSSAPDRIHTEFKRYAKLGPRQLMGSLVQQNLGGIELRQMQTAPRQLPENPDGFYFLLDRNSQYWAELDQRGFGLHVSENFPDLSVQLWAIREE